MFCQNLMILELERENVSLVKIDADVIVRYLVCQKYDVDEFEGFDQFGYKK